jgi:hypothetical protein
VKDMYELKNDELGKIIGKEEPEGVKIYPDVFTAHPEGFCDIIKNNSHECQFLNVCCEYIQ